jgi:transcriptional regulator with XRE-family HTH domain
MGFPERLAKIRREKGLGFPELARLTDIHVTQIRRYEKGESLPTLDALRRLAIALNVPGDLLLFDEDERKPPNDFLLQFDALMQLSEEEKRIARAVLDGLVLRHQAKKLMNHPSAA